MSGVATETILGGESTVSIAGSIFNLKRLWGIVKDAPVIRDVNSDNSEYTFGGRNHNFDVTIEGTTPDLATMDAWSDPLSDGDYTELAIVVTLPPVGTGTPVTASFNAKIPHSEIGQPSLDGKVLVRVAGPITSKKITWA